LLEASFGMAANTPLEQGILLRIKRFNRDVY